MALPDSGTKRVTRRSSTLSIPVEKGNENSYDWENSSSSAEDMRRDRPNVRRYVRTNAEKRDWSIDDIHERFLRAVDQLGGQDQATPKKILQLMGSRPPGLTLGQVKSHLQMHRKAGKESSGVTEEATPRSDKSQLRPHRIQPLRTSLTSLQLGQPTSSSNGMAEDPLVEGAAALMQLKEDSERSADAAGEEMLVCSPSEQIESTQAEKMESPEIFSVMFRDCVRNSSNMANTLSQQDPGPSSSCLRGRPVAGVGSFLSETGSDTSSTYAVDVNTSQSGCKRKFEGGIELELTMATRSHGTRFQFASPSSQEEADLDLALA